MHQERFEEVFLVEFLKEGSQGIKCEIGLKMVLYKGFSKVPSVGLPIWSPKRTFH